MNGGNRPPEWPVEENARERDTAPDRTQTAMAARGRASSPNWTTLGLIGGLLLLVALVAYFASSRDPDQDKLTGLQSGASGSSSDPSKLCASKSTYDLLKHDIFRRAAQVRGSDQATYDKLSAYASLRMENPVMESQDDAKNAVNCSGSLSIDLPPGLNVVGGRRTLSADVDYTVQPAADGSGNVVLLRNADAIIAPLATLTRVSQPAPAQQPTAPSADPAAPDLGQPADATPDELPQEQPRPEQKAEPSPRTSSNTHPSFDCDDARTKGEIAVCSDSRLASLDRTMAAQFGRAMSRASPEQAALLRRTRDRFLAYRDHCLSRSCMDDAYVGRMREIRDIMEGDWHPPR